MKKIIFISLLSFSIAGFSQCNITGKNTVYIGTAETFEIENDNAQCTDCHLWSTTGDNLQIQGDFRKKSVTIQPVTDGRTTLSLAVLTSQGLIQCSKNIDVIRTSSEESQAGNNTVQQKNIDCDIDVYDYKEVRYSDGIVGIFPIPSNNNFNYKWTAVYQNGEEKTSTEKVPQFPYSKENGIAVLKLMTTSNKCIKNSSKTYDVNFWKFFQ